MFLLKRTGFFGLKKILTLALIFSSSRAFADSNQIGFVFSFYDAICGGLFFCTTSASSGSGGLGLYGLVSLSPALGKNSQIYAGARVLGDDAQVDITKGGAGRNDVTVFAEYKYGTLSLIEDSHVFMNGGLTWRGIYAEKSNAAGGALSNVHEHLALQTSIVLRKIILTHLSISFEPLLLHIPLIKLDDKDLSTYSVEVSNAVNTFKNNRLSLGILSLAYAWH